MRLSQALPNSKGFRPRSEGQFSAEVRVYQNKEIHQPRSSSHSGSAENEARRTTHEDRTAWLEQGPWETSSRAHQTTGAGALLLSTCTETSALNEPRSPLGMGRRSLRSCCTCKSLGA